MKIFALAVERLGFYLLTCCVAFAPVPFGSNSDGFAGVLGLMLAGALLGTFAAPPLDPRGRWLCSAALTIIIIIAGWTVIQVAPLPISWPDSIWGKAHDLVGGAHETIAAARYQPLYALGYVLLPFVAFISAITYVRDNTRYTVFLNIVVVVGVIVTLICLGQHLRTPGVLLWAEKRHYLGVFTGPFVNPNTAATYFGVLMLLALSAGLRQGERLGGTDALRSPHPHDAEPHVRWGALSIYLGAASVLFVALMLTQSRAGITASLVGAGLLIGALGYRVARSRVSRLTALGLGVLALSGVTLAVVAFGERVLRRLDLDGPLDEGRACAFKSTWRAINDHFWRGTGLGTFQDVFPRYRLADCGLYGHWNMAHNLFLEGMLSLGVAVLAGCALAVYGMLIVTYTRGIRQRRQLRFVPLACLCILVILTLHSLVDFSLQLPSIAVLAGSVLGAGAAISLGRPDASFGFSRSQWAPAR